jgi:hypothetical protein
LLSHLRSLYGGGGRGVLALRRTHTISGDGRPEILRTVPSHSRSLPGYLFQMRGARVHSRIVSTRDIATRRFSGELPQAERAAEMSEDFAAGSIAAGRMMIRDCLLMTDAALAGLTWSGHECGEGNGL